LEAGSPTIRAIACSNCARAIPTFVRGLGKLFRVISAWATASSLSRPVLYKTRVSFKRLTIYVNGLPQKVCQSVLTAQFEIEDCQIRLFGQLLIFQGPRRSLRCVSSLTHSVAHTAPEIRLPGNIEWKIERITIRIGFRKTRGACLRLGRAVACVGSPYTDSWVVGGIAPAELALRCGHEIFKCPSDVLVRDVQFLFEGVQFRFLIDLPPFPTERRILRLSGLPDGAIRRLLGAPDS